jgi:hypothetical protein
MRRLSCLLIASCLCGCGDTTAKPQPGSLALDDPRQLTDDWLLDRLQLPATGAALESRLRASVLSSRRVLEVLRDSPLVTLGQVTDDALILEGESLPFSKLTEWSQPGRGNRFHTVLHALEPALTLCRHEHQDPGWLERADASILDWIERNPIAAPAHPRAWFEGTVSKRMFALIQLVHHYGERRTTSAVSLKLLLCMIYQHAQYLSNDATYRPRGNHGMRQDLALIAAAVSFPQFKESEAWLSTALNRLRDQQVRPGFTADGVWREHSPGYHVYVMSLLKAARDMLAGHPRERDAAFLRELDRQSQHYLTHVLDPAGELPPVGDTYRDAGAKEQLGDLLTTAESRYSLSQGREGTPPVTLDGHFPASGQVVFRDRWDQPGQSCYLHLHAELHRQFGHRQADDLSFVFHGLGRWWIIDGGRHSSEDCPEYHHLASPFAHNGWTLDGEALEPRNPGGQAFVEPRFSATPELAAARAVTTRFKQPARVTRTLVFLRQRKTIVLVDRLQSGQPGTWQQRLHLAADLAVETRAERTVARAGPHRLEIVPADAASLRIENGDTHPLRGWYAPAPRQLAPAPTLVFTRHGTDLVAVTLIRLGTGDAPPLGSPSLRDHVVEWHDGNQLIRLRIGQEPHEDLATLVPVSQ